MVGLNDIVIRKKKVRNGIYAFVTQGGISIDGISYIFYSLSDAIKKFRRDYPAYTKKSK